MNYRADKHIFELSEAEWNDCRAAVAERDALLEDNERLRAKLATVKDKLESKKGECNFLYSHLVDLVSEIASTPEHTAGTSRIYTPQINAEQINNLYYELNVWKAKFRNEG